MQEWSESVNMAVDVMVACVLVVCLLLVGSLSKSIMRAVDNERAAKESVMEFRASYAYENQECYAQDIVSLILEYQGDPAVFVKTDTGTTYSWSVREGSFATKITASAISNKLDPTSVYFCTLEHDASGGLIAYHFEEV